MSEIVQKNSVFWCALIDYSSCVEKSVRSIGKSGIEFKCGSSNITHVSNHQLVENILRNIWRVLSYYWPPVTYKQKK